MNTARFPLIASVCIAPLLAEEAAPQEATPGKWQIQESVSEKDGTKTIIASLPSEAPVFTKGKPSRPALIVRWKQGKLDAIATAFPLSAKPLVVTARFDQEPASTHQWATSEDYLALLIAEPATFIQRAQNHQRLVLRFTPHGATAVEPAFDLTGITAALEPLAAHIQAAQLQEEIKAQETAATRVMTKAELDDIKKQTDEMAKRYGSPKAAAPVAPGSSAPSVPRVDPMTRGSSGLDYLKKNRTATPAPRR